MRVRTGRFRSGGQGSPPPHDMTRWPRPRHPMLPIESALIDHLAHTGVIGADIRSVVGCQPTSSALHRSSRLPVSSFQRACPRPRLAFRLLWPLLTSHGISSVGSPQVRTRVSTTQPPHLPAGLNRTVSLCCASSPNPNGLLWGSCSSAHGSRLVFLQAVGYPSALDFG